MRDGFLRYERGIVYIDTIQHDSLTREQFHAMPRHTPHTGVTNIQHTWTWDLGPISIQYSLSLLRGKRGILYRSRCSG